MLSSGQPVDFEWIFRGLFYEFFCGHIASTDYVESGGEIGHADSLEIVVFCRGVAVGRGHGDGSNRFALVYVGDVDSSASAVVFEGQCELVYAC